MSLPVDIWTERSYISVVNAGRPREFDTEQALDAAMHLFWRQGYEATSMQDLLDNMQLSKSSLYQTFGSKHDLFQQCLDRYRQMMTSGLQQALDNAPSGKQFIEDFFTDWVVDTCNADMRIGCLIMNSATELAPHDEEVGKLIKQGTDRFAKVFQQAIERAQREGDIANDKDPVTLSYFLVSNLSGLNAMAKAGANRKVLKGIAQEIIQSLG